MTYLTTNEQKICNIMRHINIESYDGENMHQTFNEIWNECIENDFDIYQSTLKGILGSLVKKEIISMDKQDIFTFYFNENHNLNGEA